MANTGQDITNIDPFSNNHTQNLNAYNSMCDQDNYQDEQSELQTFINCP
jgi:hypothetical protein